MANRNKGIIDKSNWLVCFFKKKNYKKRNECLKLEKVKIVEVGQNLVVSCSVI